MKTPQITGIIESCLYVEDLDKSVQFYQDLFGFEKEIHDEFICVLKVANHHALILFPKRVAQQPPRTSSPVGVVEGTIPAHGGNGRMHIGFAIDTEDLEYWKKHLGKERGEGSRERRERGQRGVKAYY